ncbi:MAG: putative metallopeptidase [Pyrinomonadaceae bacterium]
MSFYLSAMGNEMDRPYPPSQLFDIDAATFGAFVPAPEVETWMQETFIDDASPLYNEDHAHLAQARIGVLWTNAVNVTKMVPVAGMVELPKPHPALGKWGKARHEWQMQQWFGDLELDFLITLYAPYALNEAGDIEWCALIEHELYHCAQSLDEFGSPAFNKRTGRPKFTIKGHDVEENIGIVRRYGATGRNVKEFVAAANRKPEIGFADVSRACGTCRLRVA